jgi:hypothetical protein
MAAEENGERHSGRRHDDTRQPRPSGSCDTIRARLGLGADAGEAHLGAASAAPQAAAPSAGELHAKGELCSWGDGGRKRRRWSRALTAVLAKRELDACGVVTNGWGTTQNGGLNGYLCCSLVSILGLYFCSWTRKRLLKASICRCLLELL